jgi:hypothetical protein
MVGVSVGVSVGPGGVKVAVEVWVKPGVKVGVGGPGVSVGVAVGPGVKVFVNVGVGRTQVFR